MIEHGHHMGGWLFHARLVHRLWEISPESELCADSFSTKGFWMRLQIEVLCVYARENSLYNSVAHLKKYFIGRKVLDTKC